MDDETAMDSPQSSHKPLFSGVIMRAFKSNKNFYLEHKTLYYPQYLDKIASLFASKTEWKT